MPRSLLLVLSWFPSEATYILVMRILFFNIFTGSQRISRCRLHKRDISGQEVRYRRIPYT